MRHHVAMEQNWVRLGQALKAARESAGLTQSKVSARIDVSINTVKNIEAGQPYKRVTPSVRAFAVVVGWTGDSPERVLAGGEPVLVEPTPAPEDGAPRRTATPKPGLPLLISEELAGGEIVDTEISYTTEGGSVLTTITVRLIPDDASPEEKRASLEAYRRTRSAPTDREA